MPIQRTKKQELSHCLPSVTLRSLHKCDPHAHQPFITADKKGPRQSISQEKNCPRHQPSVARSSQALQRRANNTRATVHGNQKSSIPTPTTKRQTKPPEHVPLVLSFSCISVQTQKTSAVKYQDHKHINNQSMKEHNNEASTQWQIGLKALLSLQSTPDSTQTHVKNTVATITQTKKSFAPIHLTRNRLRRASVTFEVSISCSVLHTRSIRYSHKSQND